MSANNLKILICDDSLLVRKKLKESLASLGEFDIIEVSDGYKALEAYKDFKPDLVFMDIVIPGANGLEALKLIREFDSNANVVMVSSTGTQANLRDAVDSGATDFIQKPWQQNQINKIVENIIQKRGVNLV